MDIFPKLPVYLRVHADKWDRNQRVQSTMKTLEHGIQKVQDLFAKTAQEMNFDTKSGSQSGKQDSDVWSSVRVEKHVSLPSSADTDGSRVGHTVVTAGRQIREPPARSTTCLSDQNQFGRKQGTTDTTKRARRTCQKCLHENRQKFSKFCKGNRGQRFCRGQCQKCDKCAESQLGNQV